MYEPLTEPQLKARLESVFAALEGRCIWRKEVRMLCWTHAGRVKADMLRIDYVLQLDDGPLVGVEVKAPLKRAAELGQSLFQATQYAAGMVAPSTPDRIVQSWVGKPLLAVFLYTQWGALDAYVVKHADAAQRLYGPANVGMLGLDPHHGLKLTLCADRLWSTTYGWNHGSIARKNPRSGNGSFRHIGELPPSEDGSPS